MVPVGLEVDLELAMQVFRKAVLGVDDVLREPPPDVLPWEFSQNNVNIRVRWWTKPQRAYEVRTRASVMLAIKAASEECGIALPADTKISFAQTPLIVEETKGHKPQKTPVRQITKDEVTAEAEFTKPADESDPEARNPNSASSTRVPRKYRAETYSARVFAASSKRRHSASSCNTECSLRRSSRGSRGAGGAPTAGAGGSSRTGTPSIT